MEMRNGIDTPHVNVIYPSGLATNMGGGRAAYFSIPSTNDIYSRWCNRLADV